MHRQRRILVFTDLDGTLLDHATYDWRPARPALVLLKRLDIPLILCSSKTAAEIFELRTALGDSANDASLLAEADRAFVMPKPDGSCEPMRGIAGERAPAPGPGGWNAAILQLLKQYPQEPEVLRG